MTMGEKILNLRKARGWSQEELAERVGVTRQAVSRWESDSAKPDADKIIALCDLFGVSADYLLRGEASGKEEKVALPERKKAPAGKKNGWWAVCISLAVFFVLKLLSSINPKYYGGWATQAVGSNDITYVQGFGGFLGYVMYYNLEWLVWLAALLGAAGLLALLWPRIRKWRLWSAMRKCLADVFGW